MGSLRFRQVRFSAYPDDHQQRYVHGFTGECEVVVDLRLEKFVKLAVRCGAVKPGNAKRSDITKILDTAAEHFDELVDLWEAMHD
jgi:hypothetical protein